MGSWSVYGVFLGTRWGLFRRKREALRVARELGGEVRRVPYAGSPSSWDYVTFYGSSVPVADFRSE